MQDVLKCGDKEIRILAEQKFYPGLRQAFDEAGIHPTEDGPCIGTPETVIAAVKKRGSPERLHHVIRMLTSASMDPSPCAEVLLDHVQALTAHHMAACAMLDLCPVAVSFTLEQALVVF